jgi:hypothetical protein
VAERPNQAGDPILDDIGASPPGRIIFNPSMPPRLYRDSPSLWHHTHFILRLWHDPRLMEPDILARPTMVLPNLYLGGAEFALSIFSRQQYARNY